MKERMSMLRKCLAGLFALGLLFVAPADARRICPILCSSAGTPSWVLAGAVVDIDFANNRAFGCSLSSCLSITRASNATDLLPSSASGYAYNIYGNNVLAISPTLGLLIFEARTNQLLNSAAPATQTTPSLANGTYTLWVNGSGSAQMSLGTGLGCGTGTATNGTPITFTITSPGTCIVTVVGSLNFEQLELGAFGTSGIITTGAVATRAADTITATGRLLSNLQTDPIWVLAQTSSVQNWAANAVIVASFPAFNRGLLQTNSGASNQLVSFDGTVLTATAGSGNFLGTAKSILTGDGTGRSLVINNGAVATDLGSPGTASTGMSIGALSGTSRFMDGNLTRLTVGKTRLSNAAAQALTQ